MTEQFYDRTRRGGHWPSVCENPQRCETARECGKDFCNITGRADAKTICYVFNANCLYGNTGRAMLAPTIIGATIFCTRRGGHWPSAISILNADRPRRNFTIESILTLGYNVPYTGIISFALPCASKTAKMPVMTAPRRTQHTINCAPAQQKRKKQHERINRKKKPPGCPKRGHL